MAGREAPCPTVPCTAARTRRISSRSTTRGLSRTACAWSLTRARSLAWRSRPSGELLKRHFRDHGWTVRPPVRLRSSRRSSGRRWPTLVQEWVRSLLARSRPRAWGACDAVQQARWRVRAFTPHRRSSAVISWSLLLLHPEAEEFLRSTAPKPDSSWIIAFVAQLEESFERDC